MAEIKDGDMLIINGSFGFELVRLVSPPTAKMMTASRWREWGARGWAPPRRMARPDSIRLVPEGADPHTVSNLLRESLVRLERAREQALDQHNARLDKIAPPLAPL